jgi:hypothetical protein
MFGYSIEVKTAALIGILDGKKGEDREMVEKILDNCRQQLKDNKDRNVQSSFYLTQSYIYSRWNQLDKAIESMKMSLSLHHDAFNPALNALIILLKKAGRDKEANHLREDYINRSEDHRKMLYSMQNG